jgi:hypothetical protein
MCSAENAENVVFSASICVLSGCISLTPAVFGMTFPGSTFIPALRVCMLAALSVDRYLAAMQAHRTETTLSEDGVLTLHGVPFRRGESVEVIVLPSATPAGAGSRYPLRGTPVMLTAPTESVAAAEG